MFGDFWGSSSHIFGWSVCCLLGSNCLFGFGSRFATTVTHAIIVVVQVIVLRNFDKGLLG